MEALSKVLSMNPCLAVAAVANESPISPFVAAVAKAYHENPRCRRAGTVEMFLRHIIDDSFHWSHYLILT